MLILGFGMSLCVAPLTNAVISSVPQTQTGIASAVNNVSLLALVPARCHTDHATLFLRWWRLAGSGLPPEARQQMLANQAHLHDIPIPSHLTQAQRAQAALLLDQAFLAGFRSVMLACAVSAWCGGLVALVAPRG